MPKTLLIVLFALLFFAFTNYHQAAVGRTTGGLPAHNASLTDKPDSKARSLNMVKFENTIKALYDRIKLSSYHLDYEVFRLAMIGYYSLRQQDALNDKDLITIIDFALPSTSKRFFTIDLKNAEVKYNTYVAHGKNTGENMAREFSNIPHSNQSSLGFYVTGETYVGSKGYSLRLDGKENLFNDNIRRRAVVIHAADYATEAFIKRYGRLGRSQGCPALPPEISREVIDAIKNKTAIFTYYPDENYLNTSEYLKLDDLLDGLNGQTIIALPPAVDRQS